MPSSVFSRPTSAFSKLFEQADADIQREHNRHLDTTATRVEKAPGFIGHKLLVAEDGERLTLVEFDSMAAQPAWSLSPEHRQAANARRKRF